MFQRSIDKNFKGVQSVSGIVYDILIAGYDDDDEKYHDRMNDI